MILYKQHAKEDFMYPLTLNKQDDCRIIMNIHHLDHIQGLDHDSRLYKGRYIRQNEAFYVHQVRRKI